MKKGLLLGCGVVTALLAVCGGAIGLLVYLVFALTGEAVTATDKLLALVAEGKLTEAYKSTAFIYQAQQSEAEFAESMKRSGLTEYKSSSWSKRNIENNQATLEGTVSTRTGATIPLVVKLVKEGNDWKVLSIQVSQGGATVPLAPPIGAGGGAKDDSDLLPREEMARLAKESLLEFNKAVKARDFTAFHHSTSKKWQEQTTPEQLKEAFKEFVTQQIDISDIQNVQPMFDPAKREDNLLVLSGHYPTPSRVKFELKYAREGDAWKLYGVNVEVGQ